MYLEKKKPQTKCKKITVSGNKIFKVWVFLVQNLTKWTWENINQPKFTIDSSILFTKRHSYHPLSNLCFQPIKVHKKDNWFVNIVSNFTKICVVSESKALSIKMIICVSDLLFSKRFLWQGLGLEKLDWCELINITYNVKGKRDCITDTNIKNISDLCAEKKMTVLFSQGFIISFN